MLSGRVPLILAAVFAVLAGLVAYLAVRQKSEEVSEGLAPVKILVASSDLKAGEALGDANIGVSWLPERLVTKSVVTLEDHRRTPIFGRRLAVPMLRGDPLLWSHIHTTTGEQRLSDAVQRKGRAVSIKVGAESAVHHWVQPSDRVDVISVVRDPRTQELVSITLLQNVLVLATGRLSGRTNLRLLSDSEKAYNTVTLHVLPEAVEMLVLAQDLGTLYLSLRNPEDHEIQDLGEGKTTLRTLLTGERSKISRTQSRILKVEIIRGSRKETQTVP